jgi:glycerol uptake facilitator-like aquaporin
VDERAPRIGGLGIGLAVLMDVLVGGRLTGAAMNPARAFGAACASGVWTHHWVYWLAPMLGGVAAARIYKSLMSTR